MGTTTRGSQKEPALPVMQHFPPSRLVIARLVRASGGGGGRPFSVTGNISMLTSLMWEEQTYLSWRCKPNQ